MGKHNAPKETAREIGQRRNLQSSRSDVFSSMIAYLFLHKNICSLEMSLVLILTICICRAVKEIFIWLPYLP